MIDSMTGFGKSSTSLSVGAADITVQTVNSRFFNSKLSIHDLLKPYQLELEKQLKTKLIRGSVNLYIRLHIDDNKPKVKLNTELALWYKQEIAKLSEVVCPEDEEFLVSQEVPNNLVIENSVTLSDSLDLPGVIEEEDDDGDLTESDLTALYKAIDEALKGVLEMRKNEGQAMFEEFIQRTENMNEYVSKIESLKDMSVEYYFNSLKQRSNELLSKTDIQVKEEDLAKEVAFFAERADIAEEISRLRHHVVHFRETLEGGGEVGRKLDFIAQEMLRETNTIASKSSNSDISKHVVDLKAEIEKIKEQVQNVL